MSLLLSHLLLPCNATLVGEEMLMFLGLLPCRRRRVSGEDEEDEEDSVSGSRQSSVAPREPTRTMPKRAA